jgi:SAM-dependent methyltransferase
MTQDYEYRGMIVEAWDLLRGDTSRWPDRAMYRELVKRFGEPVLDIGCATGRILLDFLSEGIEIDGVDLSPEMIAACRVKAEKMHLKPVLYQQDMQELKVPRHYRTILVPSSTFQLILFEEGAHQAMHRLYHHLLPGGALAMSFMVLGLNAQGEEIEILDWKLVGEHARPFDGAVVRRWTRAIFDHEHQLESTQDRYEVTLDDKVVYKEEHKRSPATRWYTQEQARALFTKSGFHHIQLYREFTFDPARRSDPLWTVVGVKPD